LTRAYIVTGLSYGDEGKGSTVDYLSRQGSTVVVRHNGGPQAGHNVVTSDGRHHTFAQFGAGTLAGAKTFLSRFMLVNPLNMMLEAEHLISLSLNSSQTASIPTWAGMFVDENAMLITPWHVAINRLRELHRRDGRHGSCGQGIGVAMEQDLAMTGLTLRVKDIADEGFWPRTEALRMYLQKEWRHLESNNPHWSAIEDRDLSEHMVKRFRQWAQMVNIVPSNFLGSMIRDHDQVIFEGAQGVLLDQWYGFHPYTTWSTTTHENALTLLREVGNVADAGDGQISNVSHGPGASPGTSGAEAGQLRGAPQNMIASLGTLEPIRLGVMRAVTTRHGPGPLPTEDAVLTAGWTEPHNTHGPWQGAFRVGHLDLVAHRYAMTVCGGVDQVVVTHLDRGGPAWKYCPSYKDTQKISLGRRGDLPFQESLTRYLETAEPMWVETDEDGLVAGIEAHLGAPVGIVSRGPTAEDKQALVRSTT
jgi:adenylosuccinate synthase